MRTRNGETRPYVAWDLINTFIFDVFKDYGVPEADTKICIDVLLESGRRGIESHGYNRFKPIYLSLTYTPGVAKAVAEAAKKTGVARI